MTGVLYRIRSIFVLFYLSRLPALGPFVAVHFAPKIGLSNSPLTFLKADAMLSVGARGVCSL